MDMQDTGMAGKAKMLDNTKPIITKKIDGKTDSTMTDGNNTVTAIKFNGIDYDLTTKAGKGALSDALGVQMKNPDGGMVNGQKVGTQGAQWEASKLNSLSNGQAKTLAQAEEIANERHAGKQGSTEAVVPKPFFARIIGRG